MAIIMTQKFDPFHIRNETHCGDCDKLLTAGSVRHEDITFFQGIRCKICYNTFIHRACDLGSPDPFDIKHYEGN